MTSRPSQLLRSRHPLSRSVVTCLTAVCLLIVTAGRVDAAPTQPPVLRSQQLAVLLTQHLVHRYPRAGSKVLTAIPPLTPITGESTTLPVVGRSHGRRGVHWLKVMLPGRPNGSSGWIVEQNTRASVTGWHLSVDLAGRRVTVYRHGAVVRVFPAVVGKPATPTPSGRFFVQETLQMAAGQSGGPFALALSARSDALQEFDGGPGQIAMHGRDELGGVLGQAESHGCVRLATPSIDWLAARIGPGVPVTISQG